MTMPVWLLFGDHASFAILFFLVSTPVRFLHCVPMQSLLGEFDEFMKNNVLDHVPKAIKKRYRLVRLKALEYKNYTEHYMQAFDNLPPFG